MFDAEMTAPRTAGGVYFENGSPEEHLWQSAEKSPAFLSALGLAVAQEKKDIQRAIGLCKEAIRQAPEDPLHYLHLGKVYLLARKKHLALYAFRKGLKHGPCRPLLDEIRRLGFRRQPPFPFLGRKHPINKVAGLLAARLGWR